MEPFVTVYEELFLLRLNSVFKEFSPGVRDIRAKSSPSLNCESSTGGSKSEFEFKLAVPVLFWKLEFPQFWKLKTSKTIKISATVFFLLNFDRFTPTPLKRNFHRLKDLDLSLPSQKACRYCFKKTQIFLQRVAKVLQMFVLAHFDKLSSRSAYTGKHLVGRGVVHISGCGDHLVFTVCYKVCRGACGVFRASFF